MNRKLHSAFDQTARKREIARRFTIRLKPSEKALLRERAGDLPISEYIRRRTLGEDAAPRRTLRRPSVDQTGLARVLGALGASRLASNLNQIAKAANQGALPVDEALILELTQACSDIADIRRALMDALGVRAGE